MDFPLFVYGTLKRGFPAHARWCAGAEVSPASCRGQLLLHEDGYPVLVIEPDDILAIGSVDPNHDARLACQVLESEFPCVDATAEPVVLRRIDRRDPQDVGGELLRFSLGSVPLAEIDDYEGFEPGKPSRFVRVLTRVVPLAGGPPVCAWTYVGGTRLKRESLRQSEGADWPAIGG